MTNEIAVMEKFEIATFSEDLAEAFCEEMEGLGQIPYDQIKIPSGGGLAFEIPGDTDEDTQTATEIIGVIVDHGPINVYWRDEFSGQGAQPDCSSANGRQGTDRLTGEIRLCKDCPHNQWGSSESGSGKACKNVHRLFLLREGNPIPAILSLPPTSIKSLNDYMAKKLLFKGLRPHQVITKVTLRKEKNKAGIAYSRAVFSLVGKLSEEQIKASESMRATIKATANSIEIGEDDYSAAPAAPSDGFAPVPEGVDSELPF